jgi:oxalate decarboxylase/phosphoglucose isomerase-like protein (cupin superfamily)
MQFMADGFVMGPGEGERVSPAMTLKVGDKSSTAWSMFEVVDIGPGFDVGAHLHRNAEELFYVLDGQLDLLAFEPRVRTPGNWQRWQLHTGPRWPAAGRGA